MGPAQVGVRKVRLAHDRLEVSAGVDGCEQQLCTFWTERFLDQLAIQLEAIKLDRLAEGSDATDQLVIGAAARRLALQFLSKLLEPTGVEFGVAARLHQLLLLGEHPILSFVKLVRLPSQHEPQYGDPPYRTCSGRRQWNEPATDAPKGGPANCRFAFLAITPGPGDPVLECDPAAMLLFVRA